MRYLEIDTGSSSSAPPPWLVRLLEPVLRILPATNPDLDSLYAQTRIWWLEIDESGAPQREIGFDGEGDPLVLGPVGRNFGFLIDSSDDWSDSDADSRIAAEQFDATWNLLWPRFASLESD